MKRWHVGVLAVGSLVVLMMALPAPAQLPTFSDVDRGGRDRLRDRCRTGMWPWSRRIPPRIR